MIPRKPLRPNNSRKSLKQLFNSAAAPAPFVKSIEEPSIATYAGPGRQNGEGFGGGNRVTRRQR
jgi:hypothetical protein